MYLKMSQLCDAVVKFTTFKLNGFCANAIAIKF